ncbi:creatininase family protein [Candidatus Bipolaricaulota bacterium]|nr:creatininase family protein [Candidatus Bipolaricaulota bacterium]
MLSDLSWRKAKEKISRAQVALIPVGSTEQHGPHLPLGTDYIIAEAIARKVSEKDEFISTPPVTVGVSKHHRQFFGTLWVSTTRLREYVKEISLSLKYHGIDRLIFVNGHGGNANPLRNCCKEELREKGITGLVYEYWRANQEEIKSIFSESSVGHAGEMETSMVMKIAPDLVQEENIQEAEEGAANRWGLEKFGVETSFDTLDFSSSGAIGKPTKASAQKGKKIFDISCKQLSKLGKWLATTNELAEKPHLD